MTLIIGGAYQGKRQYALETLGFPSEHIVPDVHLLILEMIRANKDPMKEIIHHADSWANCAVILEDICCGIVPMNTEERVWREAVGRCGAYLSWRASKVVRVFCGIGTVIKDA